MEEETIKANYNGTVIDFVISIPDEEIEKNEDLYIDGNEDNDE